METNLAIVYTCLSDGEAVVELSLMVEGFPTVQCMRWRKICSAGWSSLRIKEESVDVFKDGEFQESWAELMQHEGRNLAASQFQLTWDGVVRLREPVWNPIRLLWRCPFAVQVCSLLAVNLRLDGWERAFGFLSWSSPLSCVHFLKKLRSRGKHDLHCL